MKVNNRGFTLIELMVTLVVAAIALGLAIPSFKSQMLNNKSIALGEDFVGALNFVRSEAVKRSTRVSLCASKDGATCAGNWTEGFIAFVDTAGTDKAKPPVIADENAILQIWPAQDPNAVISVKSKDTDMSFVRYTSLGTLARVEPDPLTVTTEIKECTGSSARKISIGLSGLIGIERVACSASASN